ncbi:MAG: DUF3253 domain-containing protein [Pseudomonadota bacterium]
MHLALRGDSLSLPSMTPRQAILSLLYERAAGKTICPSEAARRLAGAGDWRALMTDIRTAGRALADEGVLVVRQGGETVDPRTARGPIRYGLHSERY